MLEYIFAKSLEDDLISKTISGTQKLPFQTVENMAQTCCIKPNTKSFGQHMRLACSIITENYTKTYRAQGILFNTTHKPDYIAPFDLVLLAATENIVVQYYRIQHKLHEYYGHELIKGFEQFLFNNLETLQKRFSTPEHVWQAVNAFRHAKGYSRLPLSKYKLVQYNETIFSKPVHITPLGLFGYRPLVKETAKRLGIPWYRTAKEYYEKHGR